MEVGELRSFALVKPEFTGLITAGTMGCELGLETNWANP
jgi:hypothetical protein